MIPCPKELISASRTESFALSVLAAAMAAELSCRRRCHRGQLSIHGVLWACCSIVQAFQNSFSCLAKPFNTSSCLINFNSMALPFPRHSFSVLLFLYLPCPQTIILYCLRQSNMGCVDGLTITLKYRPCNCSQLLFRCALTRASEFL